MKVSFVGEPLNEDRDGDAVEHFIDADTGEPDCVDRQTTEPVRLPQKPIGLSPSEREELIAKFFDSTRPHQPMLRSVGVPEDTIVALPNDRGKAWEVYEGQLIRKRQQEWQQEEKRRPHLGLWGYRNRMIRVEGWESATREEVVIRVKHFVLSYEAETARLKAEVERFERFQVDPPQSREPIPPDVQAFVWRRDGGRCVICRSQERLEFDHIIPLARGGSNTQRNIQLLCEHHNRLKGSGEVLFPPVQDPSDDEPE